MDANPSKRLSSLFQNDSRTSAPQSQGNDPLRYTAPQEPPNTSTSTSPAAANPSNAPVSIIYSTTITLYQYNKASGKYTSMGDTVSNTPSIGCVILGSVTAYNLLLYTATKQHIAQLPLHFTTFKPTLQPKLYLNFYDPSGVNWSMRFTSESQLIEFTTCCFLVKIHCEIWGKDRLLYTKSGNLTLEVLQEDILRVNDQQPQVQAGDTVAVSFQCWRMVGDATANPMEIMKKYSPTFEKSGEKYHKFRAGDKASQNDAVSSLVDEIVIGMRKGGRRMLLAPPKKTNGEDWYLLQVSLIKVKAKTKEIKRQGIDPKEKKLLLKEEHDMKQEKAAKPSSTSMQQEWMIQSLEEDLEMRELKLLRREKELQQAVHSQEQQRLLSIGSSTLYGASNALQFTPKPADTMMMEVHAKLDHIIRSMPVSMNRAATMGFGTPTNVTSILDGVERLAHENERLLLQINSQHESVQAYEKRCEEMMYQLQKTQEEKRFTDVKYQQMMTQHANWQQELATLTSARDAAITQTNRLHSEYQQLLNAYYQKQQVSSDAEERVEELKFERKTRTRLEKDLATQVQSASLMEQELDLLRKQLEIAQKLKESEASSKGSEFENQLLAQKQLLEKAQQKTHKLEQEMERLQREDQQGNDDRIQHVVTEWKMKLGQVEMESRHLEDDNQALKAQMKDLCAELDRVSGSNGATVAQASLDGEESTVEFENTQKLLNRIEMLQQRVKELEQENFVSVQQELEATGLGTVNAQRDDEDDDAIREKMSKLERELADQRAQVRSLTDELQQASSQSSNNDTRHFVSLYKEVVNDMFFRIQDAIEAGRSESNEADDQSSQQILTRIRKVMKQSTRELMQRLDPTVPEPSDTTTSDAH
uniref:Uncharacterized protein AlNc14C1138G12798 n=1 Tax=Albugo laibachii Nc14 TaxID=890382 RepID=F0X2J4_9STRA|nr:conserved hypothetical protein [Albugo laibachii Nc14]|eukprot:CCA28098.1 conserved hypothetical protein [Albugo laibachii Nc14]